MLPRRFYANMRNFDTSTMDSSQQRSHSLFGRQLLESTDPLTKFFVAMYIVLAFCVVVSIWVVRSIQTTVTEEEEEERGRPRQRYERIRQLSESEARAQGFASGVDSDSLMGYPGCV
ncbi:uncharacterized protein TRIVIDRAFT_223092 [Trichoderma virens Gv29-8]|uniref:Uncharacterized protein n=1 Tax=Hypocrea virens (strain Gv29-8 / FGSC 10586) TaxID=413071 RepID=G9MW24_HYPVG|nr:uncharacterized protein TRIVIDRAFT_223092 [Trichoderma virens Gv29-8]EHK21320.1 hypothetical protein TRIVIDRAFT_223092 [Trichoderma virens Gv29-8]UKZ47140.1 hypothetical protein TrVGV298_001354 [Trichoderma virens]